jgi:tetratricopeptide (TPR) repeat protein
VVLELTGSAFHADVGLHPVRILIERRCGIVRSTDPRERLRLLRAEVGRRSLDPSTFVPLLAPVLGIDADAGYAAVPAEGRKLYAQIAAAVQSYLLACFDGAGLIVADDVQWFDASTMEILDSLLATEGGRLMVVVGVRTGGSLPTALHRKVFELAPLTDDQANSMIAALNPSLSVDGRAAVTRRCDGIPFYIEQVVDGVSETGVPEALYEPLLARLRAGTNVMPVVEAAAIIGRQVDYSLLCSVAELSDDEVGVVLDELEDAGVLQPSGIDSWRFRHELLRELGAELIPPSIRRKLHARAADALSGVSGGEPDWRLVAAHYEWADRFIEAASAYQEASTGARRRGALAEARSYLDHAIAGLDRAVPGPDRDRRELAVRLERGFLAAAAEGSYSQAAAPDFERCLQLGGADLSDNELFSTLTGLLGFYIMRADLNRAVQVLESLRAGLDQGRLWFGPVIEASFGVVAWLRGEFNSARRHLEGATAGGAPLDEQEIDAVWFIPNEPMATAHIFLGWTRLVCGDLDGVAPELERAAVRARQLGFPQGPYSIVFAGFVEIWTLIEAGQLSHAATLTESLLTQAEAHGFDQWLLGGSTQQAAIRGLIAVEREPVALTAQIDTLTVLLDIWRDVGANVYRTFFDGILGQLLIAAGQHERAREWLDAALRLADDTEMHFYDAELLRIRAQTQFDDTARQADVRAALDLARNQGAILFELRSTLDEFVLRGEGAHTSLVDVVSRIPPTSDWPELARARSILAKDSQGH